MCRCCRETDRVCCGDGDSRGENEKMETRAREVQVRCHNKNNPWPNSICRRDWMGPNSYPDGITLSSRAAGMTATAGRPAGGILLAAFRHDRITCQTWKLVVRVQSVGIVCMHRLGFPWKFPSHLISCDEPSYRMPQLAWPRLVPKIFPVNSNF